MALIFLNLTISIMNLLKNITKTILMKNGAIKHIKVTKATKITNIEMTKKDIIGGKEVIMSVNIVRIMRKNM